MNKLIQGTNKNDAYENKTEEAATKNWNGASTYIY